MCYRLAASFLAMAVAWCAIALHPVNARLDGPELESSAPAKPASQTNSGFQAAPVIAGMISQVQTTDLYSLTAELTGEWPALVGGEPYTISTRFTGSITPVQKATQYAYEWMAGTGLAVDYHPWSASGYSNRNVVAVMTGTIRPDEIVMAVAHLDSMSPEDSRMTLAPGADDNASGSAAVLTMARIFSQYSFSRTVRLALFTGEEQGLLGSSVYAAEARARGDNIVAVVNMDMIAWNSPETTPTLDIHIRQTNSAGYTDDLTLASVFTNVVTTYGLSDALIPTIHPTGLWASDHSVFWQQGYPAMLLIEDYQWPERDFNPYYHTVSDTLQHLDMDYFTAFVKAALGTAAHLAHPILPVYVVYLPLAQHR